MELELELKDVPMPIILNAVRQELGGVIANYLQAGVPAAFLEGAVEGCLAELRARKCEEISREYGRMLAQAHADEGSEETEVPAE